MQHISHSKLHLLQGISQHGDIFLYVNYDSVLKKKRSRIRFSEIAGTEEKMVARGEIEPPT
jgi:hypothetical protein